MNELNIWLNGKLYNSGDLRLRIADAEGPALSALTETLGDLPRCPGEADSSVRDRVLMLVDHAERAQDTVASEQDRRAVG